MGRTMTVERKKWESRFTDLRKDIDHLKRGNNDLRQGNNCESTSFRESGFDS